MSDFDKLPPKNFPTIDEFVKTREWNMKPEDDIFALTNRMHESFTVASQAARKLLAIMRVVVFELNGKTSDSIEVLKLKENLLRYIMSELEK